MKKWVLIVGMLTIFASNTRADIHLHQQVETIVFMRHAEKPLLDFGQLNCQGLNRSLALPKVLIDKFGNPDFIFAPDPYWDGYYFYVRALVTITPTAIQLAMPVNVKYRFIEIENAAKEFIAPQYHGSKLFVAWEHFNLVSIAKKIMMLLGADPDVIPSWPSKDFDSLYVLLIDWASTPPKIIFIHEHEGLDGQSNTCPTENTNVETTLGVKTFVFIPQAELANGNLDQLTCQGLNRALALPKVLRQLYPSINHFVLPKRNNKAYFRSALMTIEPSIINRGSLFIPSGNNDVEDTVNQLASDEFANGTTLITWPINDMGNLARALYRSYRGDPNEIPNPVESSDTIYQITVRHSHTKLTATFKMLRENLDGQSKLCS